MEVDYYPVVAVELGERSGENRPVDLLADHEQLGSREKTWLVREDGALWLFKKPRPTTLDEAWSEKVSAEVAQLIEIPCAVVELAKSRGDIGTVARSFRPTQWDYYHGNSVLANFISGYDLRRRFGQNEHSVKNIVHAISRLGNSKILETAIAMSRLADYAILDGLIGNTDRHHENWMIVRNEDLGQFEIAPSYDHASSLGRELRDDRRLRILDEGRMLNYILGGRGKKGKGRVYADSLRKLPLSPLRMAQLICRWQPGIAQPTLDRLKTVSDRDFCAVIERVPPEFMSDIAKDFACQYLATSKSELLRSAK